MKKTVVILGAGVSGLGVGWLLSRDGYDVVVLEKEKEIGGLAATFQRSGYAFDYGPHNFHTHFPEVEDFVFRRLGVPMEFKPLQSAKIFFGGKSVPYPIKGLRALTVLDPWTALRGSADFIFTRLKLRLERPHEKSFKDWITHRYGRTLYQIYFGPYAEKVWGLPGEKIDLVVASKKVPTASLLELLIRALFRTGPRRLHSEDTETVRSYYPEAGIGAVSEKLAAGILARGCRILMNAVPRTIHHQNGSVTEIEYLQDRGPGRLQADLLINTIPLNEFVTLLGGSLPASRLQFRSMVLVYLIVGRERVFDVPWMYFNDPADPDVLFNRAYEVGNFSRGMTPPGKSVLCLEITCALDDQTWKTEADDLAASCIRYLERHGFFRRAEVEDAFIKRLPVAYPVFEVGYRSALRKHLDIVGRFANVASIGRQGGFTYSNVDHCLAMAMDLQAFIKKDPGFENPDGFRTFQNSLIEKFG